MSNMLESWRDGEPPSRHMQASCATHGVIALGPRGVVLDMVGTHFAAEHDGQAVVVEGADFLLEPAPYRCDVYGAVAEPPWWTWVIDPPLFDMGDGDGRWLVCEPCDALLRARDVKRLAIRCVREQARQSPDLPREAIYEASIPRIQRLMEGAVPTTFDSSYR